MRSSTRRRTPTSIAASTRSPSGRPPGSKARARRCGRSSTRRRHREVIFTRSATEALNLVAYAWGLDNLGPGDVVVITELEHHANFVPWQFIAKQDRRGVRASSRSTTTASCSSTRSTRSPAAATSRSSRTTSSRTRSARSTRSRSSPRGRTSRARSWSSTRRRQRRTRRSTCRRSAATSSRSRRTSCAGRAASARCGGARAARGDAAVQPRRRDDPLGPRSRGPRWNELPYKFEAGTPAIAEAYGFGAAIDYLEAVGLEAIEAHEHELVVYAMDGSAEIPGPRSTARPPTAARASSASSSRTSTRTTSRRSSNWEGVAVRAGHHCSQPLMKRLGVAATTRASFYLYSIPEDIDRLVAGLLRSKEFA